MNSNKERLQGGTPQTEEEVMAEFRGYLSRRISNVVEALYEEVPKEAWPRLAARLEAAGYRLMSDDDRPMGQ